MKLEMVTERKNNRQEKQGWKRAGSRRTERCPLLTAMDCRFCEIIGMNSSTDN